MTPQEIKFFKAAVAGDAKTVLQMLKAGVDPNTLDDRGIIKNVTALMEAAQYGHTEVVEVLLQSGARLDVKTKGKGMEFPGGATALLWAIKEKHSAIAHRLLDAGASVNVKSGDATPLSDACFVGDVTLVKRLLEMDCDPNAQKSKRDAIPIVCAVLEDRDQSEVVKLLLESGADPNKRGEGDFTAVLYAATNNFLEPCRLLLENGADPNLSKEGFTPLIAAVKKGRRDIVKLLLSYKAEVNTVEQHGLTALDFAMLQLEKKDDDDDLLFVTRRKRMSIAQYRELYTDIADSLHRAGGKRAAELSSPRIIAETKAENKTHTSPRKGITDFLDFVDETEREFAVMAFRTTPDIPAEVLMEVCGCKQRISNVARHPANAVDDVDDQWMPLITLQNNPWTILICSLFRLESNGSFAFDVAKQLSLRLNTRTFAFVADDTSSAVIYELFENGESLERAEWFVDDALTSFKSSYRRKPRGENTGEDVADKLCCQEGIYIPACYVKTAESGAALCVEEVSAPLIVRADLLAR